MTIGKQKANKTDAGLMGSWVWQGWIWGFVGLFYVALAAVGKWA